MAWPGAKTVARNFAEVVLKAGNNVAKDKWAQGKAIWGRLAFNPIGDQVGSWTSLSGLSSSYPSRAAGGMKELYKSFGKDAKEGSTIGALENLGVTAGHYFGARDLAGYGMGRVAASGARIGTAYAAADLLSPFSPGFND